MDLSIVQTFPGEHSFYYTQHRGHAEELANQVCSQSDLIISAGGDGTLNEVVNGVMNSHSIPAITVFPLGTGNDFARNFELNADLHKLKQALYQPHIQEVDVGSVHIEKYSDTKYFINVLDVGLGAEVVKKMNLSNRFWGAQLTYLWVITSSFLKFKPRQLKIFKDEIEFIDKQTISFVIANGAWFGNNIKIAPEAHPGDQVLQCTHLGDFSFISYLFNLPKAKKGRKIVHEKATYGRGKSFRIEGHAEIEADGEYMGPLPAKITIFPKALRFLTY